jgi:2-oxoisovalerate ferredoxin oxidoreductase beta subunit
MVEDVRLAVGGAREIVFYGRMGGMVPDELEIFEQIERAFRDYVTTPPLGSPADVAARTRLLESEHYVRHLPSAHPIPAELRIRRDTKPPAADQAVVVDWPASMDDAPTHYCPGCGHGNLHLVIARAADELSIREKTIMIEPVGCSVVTYWTFDTIQAAHGRGMALASAVSRTRPDRVVISYQGDGDLASIGMAETIHAASRGEDFVLVFVNNCIYGMTGGQMAPTTIPGLPTTTCPAGRDVLDVGTPIDMCKLFSQLDGVTYLERVAIDGPGGLAKTSRAIRHALKLQADGVGGLKVVEVLSPCPVGWKMTPAQAHRYIKDVVSKSFPLGKFKDVSETVSEQRPTRKHPAAAPPAEVFNQADLHWVAPADGYRKPTGFVNPGLRIAGHGGQGIVLLSGLLVHAAVRTGQRISLLPSYGSAMRGGTCNCQVRISDSAIASPYVSDPDILVAMNQPSLEKFGPTVRPGGLLLADSTLAGDSSGVKLAENVRLVHAPMTKIAAGLGNERMANIVAAGVLIGLTGLLDPQAIRDSIPEIFAHRPKLVAPNLAAFEAGLAFAAESAKGKNG